MDWSDLPVFLAVMREGSALGAARRLGTDQATVGRRLKRLERTLALPLFERGPRGAVPTAAARALLADAEATEAAATALAAHADALRRRPTGTIRLTMPPGTPRHIAMFLGAFQADHPGIRFELDDTDTVRRLEAGEADIAIRAADTLEGDDLIARKLMDHPWGLFASEAFLAAHGPLDSVEAAGAHPAVLYAAHVEAAMPFVGHVQARLGDAAPRTRVSTVVGMAGMLLDGMGVGLLPRSTGDREVGLRFVLSERVMVQRLWLVWSREAAATPHVATFLAYCGRELDRALAAMPKEWLA